MADLDGPASRCPFSGAAQPGVATAAAGSLPHNQQDSGLARRAGANSAPLGKDGSGEADDSARSAEAQAQAGGQGQGQGHEDARSFIERKVSNIFDGFTPFSLLKAFAPAEVLVGMGVLLSALLCTLLGPRAVFALAAVMLLPPLVRLLAQAPDPRAPAVRYGVHMGKIEGEFCVFLLGARSNKPWLLNPQFGFVGKSFRKIMRELERLPASAGYLGGEMFTSVNMLRGSHVMAVTYWRSYDHMIRFTYDRGLAHMEAIGLRDSLFGDMRDCGIWHEAYMVKPGQYETVYLNCPPLHFGAAADVVPAVGPLRHAKGRVNSSLPGAMPNQNPSGGETVEASDIPLPPSSEVNGVPPGS